MNIRMLEEKDAEPYRSLRLAALKESPEAFLMTYDEEIRKEDPIANIAARLGKSDVFTFGAFVGEELAAVTTLELESPIKISHKGNILAMYVAKDHRGTRLGQKLLEAVMEKVKERGLEQLQLSVIEENISARRLYESVGFQTYSIEKQAFKLGERYWNEYNMVKFL
ncbi:GNAT family N-acetyltransferase [Salicibibacter kimchii]|uniref:GNAT family N-acetyltransferase n=1 Tax=Salicibibacter kimchii TaxID=2099786 RepID=UPI00135BD1F1|nr:GNAT family N-acetyltransferase [Salicibibacter kimchii]